MPALLNLQDAATVELLLGRERQMHQAAEADGTEILWLCETVSPAVVLGRSSSIYEVRKEICAQDGVPVVRRDSGGGIVLLGPGCLNYSLVLNLHRRPHLLDVGESYRLILSAVASCFDRKDVVRCEGSDLLSRERKFAGCSQRRLRNSVLHHGTLMYNFDIDAVTRYLEEPQKRPAHRGERTHSEFLTNVALPLDFAQRLAGRFPEAQTIP